MKTKRSVFRKLRDLKLGENYEPGRDYDFTRAIMKKLKVKSEESYDSTQRDHFKKTIDKRQDIRRLIAEYEELKKADWGITFGISTNFLLFSFVVPYLLFTYNNGESLVPIIAAVLSTLWGVGWTFNFLAWEDGITLIKSKLQPTPKSLGTIINISLKSTNIKRKSIYEKTKKP